MKEQDELVGLIDEQDNYITKRKDKTYKEKLDGKGQKLMA